MNILTKPYGAMDIDERQVITFPRGLLGFEACHQWALLDSSQPPFYWLQSLDDPGLAFIMIDPFSFRPDYELDLGLADQQDLDAPAPEDLLLFAIVTIPQEPRQMTANLQGPVVINRRQRRGIQAIQGDSRWKTRHHIMEEMAALQKEGR